MRTMLRYGMGMLLVGVCLVALLVIKQEFRDLHVEYENKLSMVQNELAATNYQLEQQIKKSKDLTVENEEMYSRMRMSLQKYDKCIVKSEFTTVVT